MTLLLIISAIVLLFLVVVGCISDHSKEKVYNTLPETIKQGGDHSLPVASSRLPVSFNFSRLIADAIKLTIIIFVVMLMASCGKNRNYCWSCTSWQGTDFEVCDMSKEEVNQMMIKDTCNCIQK